MMFNQPNAGERFAQGFEQGQERAKQNRLRAAMAELARNPDNEGAYRALAESDPQAAMQYKQQRIEAARTQLKDYQGQIEIGAQIIREVNPQDQAGLDRARSLASQYGINPDALGVPTVWDQGGQDYVQKFSALANVLAPPKQGERSRIVTPQPGGGAFELGPDGKLRTLIQPNDGSQPMGAPAKPLTDDEIRAMEGGQSGPPQAGNF